MEDDQNRFLAAGMNAYITKPFNEEALFRTIKNLAPHTIVPHS
jgi:CheY-like chemotaxis protein